jgi:methionyl-tRNA synthetase
MPRVLITSALPYINGVKHLGNLVGSMLPADIYARFQRARGRDTLFICATDEHGTPAELAALAAGQSVAEYCREQHAIQKDVGDRFGLSWDYFGRSSSPQNHTFTQEFARALWRNGHLEVRTTRQVYSRAERRFLPDRYVVGTCPHCGYELARGDQCENCTRVLDPTDLVNPRSAVSGSPDIDIRDSTHLFLKQSAFAGRLREWFDSKKGDWPPLVTSIAFKWLDEGLNDRGITRDLSWGVPVPDDIADGALRGKVFYVWFDAPIEYIGATHEWADANGKGETWRDWWTARASTDPSYVRYVEFMAKDNVPFHTVGFPVTLFGVNDKLPDGRKWKIVDQLKGFNWLTYYGGKFSTSQKRGVFMDTALDLLPADYWRYYLIANAPESADTSFTWEHFAMVVNKDLADVLGNFVNRVTRFTAARFDGKVPDGGAFGDEEVKLARTLDAQVDQYTTYLEAMEFRKALTELRGIWVQGNEYLTRAAPWTSIKQSRSAAALSVRTALNLTRLFACLSWPIIPDAARRTSDATGAGPASLEWPDEPMTDYLQALQAGEAITPPDLLFAKIEEDKVAEWRTRFGGEETTR